MIYIKKFNQFNILNELYIHTEDKEELEGKKFILYKKDVWIFDEEDYHNYDNEEDSIWYKINKEVGSDILNGDDLIDDIMSLEDTHPYILSGYIEDDSIILSGRPNFRHGSLSSDLKKLSNYLDMEVKVNYYKGSYNEYDSSLDEILAKTYEDAYFYHGTSLKYLKGISKLGIKPINNVTNFKNIKHNGKIFFTTNLERALFHANTTALNTQSFPIILKFKLPDPSKLIYDYDLAIQFYGIDDKNNNKLGYSGIAKKLSKYIESNNSIVDDSKNVDIAKKLGVFGYIGRIPTSFIEDVFIDIPVLEEYWEYFDEINPTDHEISFDDEMWNVFDDVDMWSELSIKEVLTRIDILSDEHNEEDDDDYEDE